MTPGPSSETERTFTATVRASMVWLYALALVMVGVALAQSFLIVKQHEMAFVFRFGELRKVARTGLHLLLPYPIDRAMVFDVGRSRRLDSKAFLPAALPEGAARPATLRPGIDGYVLSGDLNILHLESNLSYAVDNGSDAAAGRYFLAHQDTEAMLRALLDNALLHAAAGSTADDALFSVEAFRSRAASLLRGRLARTDLGVSVEGKDLSCGITPPLQAKQAFDRLTLASQQQDQLRNEAQAYRIKTVREGAIEANALLSESRTDMGRRISAAQAEADAFTRLLERFETNPALVLNSIYQDALFRILGNLDEKFVVRKSEGRQIRVLLGRNLDPPAKP